MIFSIIFQIFISFIIIYIIHYLYNFFINNLTTPKIKDLVHKPNDTYKEIYETINKPAQHPTTNSDSTKMKQDLKDYLKELADDKASTVSNYNMNDTSSLNIGTTSI